MLADIVFDEKSYLEEYGYLEYVRLNVDDGTSEDRILELAIKTFQQYCKLNPTGILDDQTLSKMNTAVCVMGGSRTNFDQKPTLDQIKHNFDQIRNSQPQSEVEILGFAIKTLQRKFGIEATGKLDDETRAYITALLHDNIEGTNYCSQQSSTDFDPQFFLEQFGYRRYARRRFHGSASEWQISEFAIKKFQGDCGIKRTGKLDEETISRMKKKSERDIINTINAITQSPVAKELHVTSRAANGSKMARFSSRRASDPDKAILWASKAISDVADRLSLEETIKDRACLIYKTLEDEKCTRGRNKEALVSACVYLACREEGGPRTVKEISSTVARATEKDIGRAIEFIVKQLKAKPGESMVMDTILPGEYLRRLCFNLGMSNEEMKVVQESVRKARDFDIRKSPMSVAGAIIFMVTQLSGSKKSLQDISVATAVAEGTIKNSYTELLPHASEFMPQWYAKEQDLTNLNLDHSNPEV